MSKNTESESSEKQEAQKNLMIYDVGADDVLEIEEIKIESL
jgi:hypothetical protein